MTARIPESVLDRAEELYNRGLSLREISEVVGRSDDALRKRLKERGVAMRKTSQGRVSPNTIVDLPEDIIILNYKAGESENTISKRFLVSRNVIRRILNKHNVHIRSRSESEKLKWSRMTGEQKHNQVRKAHNAVTGTAKSDDAKRKLAITREAHTPEWYIGRGEVEFKKWLAQEGIDFKYQKAVEFYNIDFLINGVAVELTSFIGRNRLTRDDFMNRAKILHMNGIKTLAVEFRNEKELINHAHDVIDMVNRVKSEKYRDIHYVAYRLQFNEPDIRILA